MQEDERAFPNRLPDYDPKAEPLIDSNGVSFIVWNIWNILLKIALPQA